MIPEMTTEMFRFALGEDANHQKRGRIMRIVVLNTKRIINTADYKTASRNGDLFNAWWAGFQAQTMDDVFRGLTDLNEFERAAFVMGGRYVQSLLAAGSGELR